MLSLLVAYWKLLYACALKPGSMTCWMRILSSWQRNVDSLSRYIIDCIMYFSSSLCLYVCYVPALIWWTQIYTEFNLSWPRQMEKACFDPQSLQNLWRSFMKLGIYNYVGCDYLCKSRLSYDKIGGLSEHVTCFGF